MSARDKAIKVLDRGPRCEKCGALLVLAEHVSRFDKMVDQASGQRVYRRTYFGRCPNAGPIAVELLKIFINQEHAYEILAQDWVPRPR